MHRVFMIGHSNHAWPAFKQLLLDNDIKLLVDVRSSPRSRQPHFNAGPLQRNLPPIHYEHAPGLGGKNPLAYPEQRRLLEELLPKSHHANICLMCSEGDFKECHRHYTITRLIHEIGGYEVHQIKTDGSVVVDEGPTALTLKKMAAYLPAGSADCPF